jgi:hypothetical protein
MSEVIVRPHGDAPPRGSARLIVIIGVPYRRVEIDRVCKALTRLSIDVLLRIITIITISLPAGDR